MTNKVLLNIIRLGFLTWIVFELLNWAEILHFTLDFTWLGLVLTSGFVWGVLEIISARLNKSTGKPLPWFVFLLALMAVSFDALGDVMHWYVTYEWYDQVGHVLGGSMAALGAFFVFWHLNEAGKISIGKKLASFMAFTTSAFLGVLYELEEYLEDVFTGGNRLGSGVDTANDMMWNTIGGLVIVFVIIFLVRKGHTERSEVFSGQRPGDSSLRSE